MYLLGKDNEWSREFGATPKPRRNVAITRTLSVAEYIKDYTFFTFAPLYVHAGVRYSMPDQFEAESGEQDRILVDYRRTVISGLGKWGALIEGIRNETWPAFCRYLMTVLFTSINKELVWFIRSQQIDVEGTDASVIITPGGLPVQLTVFLPDGNKARMRLKGGYPAKLWWDKPQANIVEAAGAILRCKGKIENEN